MKNDDNWNIYSLSSMDIPIHPLQEFQLVLEWVACYGLTSWVKDPRKSLRTPWVNLIATKYEGQQTSRPSFLDRSNYAY